MCVFFWGGEVNLQSPHSGLGAGATGLWATEVGLPQLTALSAARESRRGLSLTILGHLPYLNQQAPNRKTCR